ncbi:MAG TPA: helix-turn-helix domain-containing protein [Chloroflexia bacterium]|nr:helix-turn-helix domain-containing protein [Chloroflexia bacterium]
MNEELIDQLREVGLTANEAKIYINMLGRPLFKAAEIAQVSEVPRPKVYEALSNLLAKGFCFPVAGAVAQYSAVAPEEALPAYQQRLEHDLERTVHERRQKISQLVERLEPLHLAGRSETGLLRYIDILTERGRIMQVANELLNSAQHSILIFEKEPYAQDQRALNSYEIAASQRGVEVRCVFEASVRNLQNRAKTLAAAGAEVRLAPSLPMKLIVTDDHAAVCALRDPITGQQNITSIRIEHADFTQAMRLLFESIWQTAQPFDASIEVDNLIKAAKE